MAMRTPCVTTSFVNESIGARPEMDILIADNKAEFLMQIKRLLSHPQDYEKLVNNGRRFVEQNYDWTVNTAILNDKILSHLKHE